MPLDSAQTNAELDDLRRRAGIPTTPAYQKLNPAPITIQLSREELIMVVAALQHLVDGQETAPAWGVLKKLTSIRNSQPKPEPYRHNPFDANNPFRQTALFRATSGE